MMFLKISLNVMLIVLIWFSGKAWQASADANFSDHIRDTFSWSGAQYTLIGAFFAAAILIVDSVGVYRSNRDRKLLEAQVRILHIMFDRILVRMDVMERDLAEIKSAQFNTKSATATGLLHRLRLWWRTG